MLDFLKFWKKKDEMPSFPESPEFGQQEMPREMPGEIPGISTPPGFEPTSSMPDQPLDFSRGAESPRAFGQAEPAALDTSSFGRPSSGSSDKEFQLINAKLDGIKAAIDGLHQRLDKMELEKDRRREEKDIYAWR